MNKSLTDQQIAEALALAQRELLTPIEQEHLLDGVLPDALRALQEARQANAQWLSLVRQARAALDRHSPGGATCSLPYQPCEQCDAVLAIDACLPTEAPPS